MTTKDEALKKSIQTLESAKRGNCDNDWFDEAIQTCHDALAQPEQEPVAGECRFEGETEWKRCSAAHHLHVQAHPNEWPGYETRALYATQQPAPAVSQGWKLVPVEPTPPMLQALWAYKSDSLQDAYSAMLAAAPQAPAVQPLPPRSICDLTQAEAKIFKLGWLECQAAHGIGAPKGNV